MSDINEKSIGRAGSGDLFLRFMIALTCICVLIQIYAIPHKATSLTSLSNLILSISWVLFGAFKITNGYFKRVSGALGQLTLVVLLAVIGFAIGLLLDGAVISQFGKLIGFLSLPLMLYGISVARVGDKTRRLVLFANFIASVQYILLYHSGLRNVFTTEYGTTNIPSVTLGFANPNQTASMLFVCLILLFASLFFFRNILIRIVLFADMAYLAYILFETDSRTAILLLAVFFVFSFLAIRNRLPKIFTEFCMLAPLIYLLLAFLSTSLFSGIEILGDSIFTGREDIYARYFENLDLISFLFGDLSEFPFENLHNGYISIAAACGIIVFLLYYFFLRKTLISSLPAIKLSKPAAIAYSGLLCVVIYTSTEAGFLVGGSTYAALIAMIFIIIPHDSKAAIEH